VAGVFVGRLRRYVGTPQCSNVSRTFSRSCYALHMVTKKKAGAKGAKGAKVPVAVGAPRGRMCRRCSKRQSYVEFRAFLVGERPGLKRVCLTCREKGVMPPAISLVCEICRAKFSAFSKSARSCSLACSKEAVLRAQRLRRKRAGEKAAKKAGGTDRARDRVRTPTGRKAQ